jgi:hypothetical protein
VDAEVSRVLNCEKQAVLQTIVGRVARLTRRVSMAMFAIAITAARMAT